MPAQPPLLQQWARRCDRRFLCRNAHHDDAPLNQLADQSWRGSVTRCWERSAVLCLLDLSSPCRAGPWGRGGAATSASHLPEPTFIAISTVEARPIGLTNPGTADSSQRCSYRRSVSRADSVAEATMRVFYNAPLRRQALVLSAPAAQEIEQPRRIYFLPLALVEHLVTGCVAQHVRDRRGRSASRWSPLCGKTSYGFSLSLAERH